MSKKMMKRSLALGALMAFVITGNALAANITENGITLWIDCAEDTVFKASENNANGVISGNYSGKMFIGKIGEGSNTVTEGVVTVSNGGVADTIYGGFGSGIYEEGSGIIVSAGKVENNKVIINDGSVSSTVYGGYGFGDVCTNEVTLNGGTVNGSVYGGYSTGGSVTGNKVSVIGGTITGDVYGGLGDLTGDSANDNMVVVSGGTVSGSVYGARTQNGTTESNEVILSGGTINSEVYGAYIGSVDSSDKPVASGNTISLQGNVDVSSAKLYGNNGGAGTGNKLEVDEGYTGNGNVHTVGAFDEIVIEKMEYGKTALTVTNINYKETDEEGNGGTKITVNKMTMSGDETLAEGAALNVIGTAEGGSSTGNISKESTATVYKGTSVISQVTFGGEDSQITEIVSDRNDQVLVIGESRAAATAFVNQGSEIVETGLDALARDNSKAGDTKVFAAVYGNASEYATGSHVKVNGWSGIVGIGKTNDNGLTVGAFFENGEGNYRTYNTVNNDFMRGDGEATYNGGGFLVRKDNKNGVYTEASLRAGNLQNELRNAVRGHEGLAGYDVDTFYYGAHLGVGKIIPRGNEGDSIDVYGKFIYTHHDSEDFNIDGSDFHFDSVDSERLRLGFRINEVQTNKLSMYYGAAWEYEFNGDADNTTVGYDLATPSLGGSTMIGEIGMHYNASEKWSLDLNVRGYSGQRDGFTGSVQANYAF